MSNCTSCNKELALNAKYCKFCGASQVVKPQASSNTPVVTKVELAPACTKCGNTLTQNAKFCKHCGTNVIKDHVNILPITETQNVAADSKTASINKKTGISGTQIAVGLTTIILLAFFAFITKSNNNPAEIPALVIAPQPAVASQKAEATPAKQAEDISEQKRLADEESKRNVEEEQKKLAYAKKVLQIADESKREYENLKAKELELLKEGDLLAQKKAKEVTPASKPAELDI